MEIKRFTCIYFVFADIYAAGTVQCQLSIVKQSHNIRNVGGKTSNMSNFHL